MGQDVSAAQRSHKEPISFAVLELTGHFVEQRGLEPLNPSLVRW